MWSLKKTPKEWNSQDLDCRVFLSCCNKIFFPCLQVTALCESCRVEASTGPFVVSERKSAIWWVLLTQQLLCACCFPSCFLDWRCSFTCSTELCLSPSAVSHCGLLAPHHAAVSLVTMDFCHFAHGKLEGWQLSSAASTLYQNLGTEQKEICHTSGTELFP